MTLEGLPPGRRVLAVAPARLGSPRTSVPRPPGRWGWRPCASPRSDRRRPRSVSGASLPPRGPERARHPGIGPDRCLAVCLQSPPEGSRTGAPVSEIFRWRPSPSPCLPGLLRFRIRAAVSLTISPGPHPCPHLCGDGRGRRGSVQDPEREENPRFSGAFWKSWDCLKVEGGGAEGSRTPDLRIANATLSQLSYGPIAAAGGIRPGRRRADHAAACRAMSSEGRRGVAAPPRPRLPARWAVPAGAVAQSLGSLSAGGTVSVTEVADYPLVGERLQRRGAGLQPGRCRRRRSRRRSAWVHSLQTFALVQL